MGSFQRVQTPVCLKLNVTFILIKYHALTVYIITIDVFHGYSIIQQDSVNILKIGILKLICSAESASYELISYIETLGTDRNIAIRKLYLNMDLVLNFSTACAPFQAKILALSPSLTKHQSFN